MSQSNSEMIHATHVTMNSHNIHQTITWHGAVQDYFGDLFETMVDDILSVISSIMTTELMTDFVNVYVQQLIDLDNDIWSYSDIDLLEQWINKNIIPHPSIRALKVTHMQSPLRHCMSLI